MADYLTAGTFIGAVLEQSGYLAQSRFLKDFKDFFREAGAFIYLLGGIGAVVSVVVFGSFRAARYLILGPIFYWFLIGPTMTFDGVAWQIGGGAPRDFYRKVGDESFSAKSVQAIIDDAGLNYNGGQVEVAYFFGMFAKVINTVTRDLSLEIISNDDDEYKHAISKARALEYLTNLEPDNAILMHMFEKNLMVDCMWMTGAALDASGYDIHPDALAVLSASARQTSARRREFDLKAVEEGKRDHIALKTAGSVGMTEYLSANGGNLPDSITCDEVWKIVAESITNYARNTVKPILMRIAKGNEANEQQVCERIKEKLVEEEGDGAGGGAGGGCDLTNLIALFVLKNSLARQSSLARMSQWIVNDSKTPGLLHGEMDLRESTQNLAGYQNSQGMVTALRRRQDWKRNLAGPLDATPASVTQGRLTGGVGIYGDRSRAERNEHWTADAKLQGIGGGSDPAFAEMPRYNMRNLRQQLFTWSQQLPFWQGLILYLLAIVYPFFALVVLLPGRAASFLLLPMAWLWVKSWDVGFACVLVFERVLWNVFPSLQIKKELATTPLADIGIVKAMGEAQKFDHIHNLHMYYTLLSLATLSVPMVMGMATIRSRRAVLSSFTDKLVEDTKAAGGMAAAAYQYGIAAERNKMQQDIMGLAAQMSNRSAEGPGGGGRVRDAEVLGFLAGGTKAAQGLANFGEQGHLARDAAIAGADTFAVLGKVTKTTGQNIEAQARYERSMNLAFDPILGYHGVLQRYEKAYAVAMDTSGGFEIMGQNQPGSNAIDDYIGLLTTKVETLMSIAEDTSDAVVHGLQRGGALTPAIYGMTLAAELSQLSENERAAVVGRLDAFTADVSKMSLEDKQAMMEHAAVRNYDALPATLNQLDATLRHYLGDQKAEAFLTSAICLTPVAMEKYRELMAMPSEARHEALQYLMPENYQDLLDSINPTPRELETMPGFFKGRFSIPTPDDWWTAEKLRNSEGAYYSWAFEPEPAPTAVGNGGAGSPASGAAPIAVDNTPPAAVPPVAQAQNVDDLSRLVEEAAPEEKKK